MRRLSIGKRRTGGLLVEFFFCLLLVIPIWAGFVAAKGHGVVARIVGLMTGAVLGAGGLLTGMLLVSALLAVMGPGDESSPESRLRSAAWRRTADRIAAGVLVVTLLSTPLWAALGSSSLVHWLYGP